VIPASARAKKRSQEGVEEASERAGVGVQEPESQSKTASPRAYRKQPRASTRGGNGGPVRWLLSVTDWSGGGGQGKGWGSARAVLMCSRGG
jgi:hypothetical protein